MFPEISDWQTGACGADSPVACMPPAKENPFSGEERGGGLLQREDCPLGKERKVCEVREKHLDRARTKFVDILF